MKRLLLILIFTLSLQYWTNADDIREFEIEGMSIGDKLIDHFLKKQIVDEINSDFAYHYKDNKFSKLSIGQTSEFSMKKNLEIYDEIGVTIKPDDKNFIIYGLSGDLKCDKNIQKCFEKKDEVLLDIKNFFNKDIYIDNFESKHWVDETGKSIVYGNEIFSKSNNELLVSVTVYDMNEDLGYVDQVSVEIASKEYEDFLREQAQ